MPTVDPALWRALARALQASGKHAESVREARSASQHLDDSLAADDPSIRQAHQMGE